MSHSPLKGWLMTVEDLICEEFNPNQLSYEDSVRFRFAKEVYHAGEKCLAAQILSGDADDYFPMRVPLFLASRDEHGPAYLAAWDRLTS